MPKILCTVPAATPKIQIQQTEAAFKDIYAEHFGSDKGLMILWILSPEGQTFQAGHAADIFLAMIEVEDGLDQTLREPAMWAFTKRWAQILEIDIERLMVTCADSSTVSEYMAGNRNRLRPLSRVGFMISTIVGIVRTRRADGFAQLRANL